MKENKRREGEREEREGGIQKMKIMRWSSMLPLIVCRWQWQQPEDLGACKVHGGVKGSVKELVGHQTLTMTTKCTNVRGKCP